MNLVFSLPQYVLKRQGLAIFGKYRLYAPENNEPLLYIEEKSTWIPPSTVIHLYADQKKTREVLRLKESETEDLGMDVIDPESGEKIGGVGGTMEHPTELFKKTWGITDAAGEPVAWVLGKNLGQAILREVLDSGLPENLEIRVGESLVGEVKQKNKLAGYELVADFSLDSAHLLDRRLGLAAMLQVAFENGRET